MASLCSFLCTAFPPTISVTPPHAPAPTPSITQRCRLTRTSAHPRDRASYPTALKIKRGIHLIALEEAEQPHHKSHRVMEILNIL